MSLEIVGICFAAAFSPDGKRLATLALRWTNSTYEIKIWDVVTGHELMVLGPFEIAAADKFNSTGGFVQPVGISPTTIANPSDYAGQRDLRLIFDADGKRLLLPTQKGTVLVFDSVPRGLNSR